MIFRPAVAGAATALALALAAACSGGSGSSQDGVAGDRAHRATSVSDVRELAEVRRLFQAIPQQGELMDASEGSFCDANRRAARAEDFSDFQEAVKSIESVLPDDMPRRPRAGFGLLLHTLNGAEGRSDFRHGVRVLDDDSRALVQTFKEYSDRLCGRLAPDAEALA